MLKRWGLFALCASIIVAVLAIVNWQAESDPKAWADANARREREARTGTEAEANSEASARAEAETKVVFRNSLGMKFAPVPGTEVPLVLPTVLFSVWDTRLQDYEAFATATGRSWDKPSISQGPDHPAVNVSWNDAQAFANWLTEKERRDGTLTAGQHYRLPADREWSVAVGLKEPLDGKSPRRRT